MERRRIEKSFQHCPTIFIYAYNCYKTQARLFILGCRELASREGTTQCDLTAMVLFGIGLISRLNTISQLNTRPQINFATKLVAYADDLTGAGKLIAICESDYTQGCLNKW